ncbi:hypothetical protein L1276_001443 [Flavobacterium sp. HSC-32F16]|uniref:DUF6585 family protein n=1 Tax=Flavobacterium sp. HSC-32F16 TaxID=2910964 RepID=UPI0020A3A48D|nr:DUF6585 family protein [Flavobacterium sp. HSC-32F16]MCP2026299.1 hypothetical protein [Flavobacterium sp. HSC-32F16]
MSTHPELGKLELKSVPSKTFLYFAVFICILFAAICGLIYFGAIIPINQGKSTFSGDISILYITMIGIMILGIAILLLSIVLTKGAVFYLHEKGIVAVNKESQKITLYSDIQHVYLFTSGKRIFGPNNIAFRNNERTDWQAISAKYSNYGAAITTIRTRQQEANFPKILQQLNEGKSVNFHYIDYAKLLSTQFFALNTKSYLNVIPKTLVLYKDKLIAGHETIYLSDVQRFSTNDWTSQIKLLNKENKTLFSISFYSVFSGDSFTATLDKLINK